jgi:hypothetical protein
MKMTSDLLEQPYFRSHPAVRTFLLALMFTPLGIVALVLLIMAYDYEFQPKDYYAMDFSTKASNVFVTSEPHNCEWMSAPLGDKHCHYEKNVTSWNERGEIKVAVMWDKIEDQ